MSDFDIRFQFMCALIKHNNITSTMTTLLNQRSNKYKLPTSYVTLFNGNLNKCELIRKRSNSISSCDLY